MGVNTHTSGSEHIATGISVTVDPAIVGIQIDSDDALASLVVGELQQRLNPRQLATVLQSVKAEIDPQQATTIATLLAIIRRAAASVI